MRGSLLFFVLLPLLAFSQQKWTMEQCIARAEEKNLNVLNAALDMELAGREGERAWWDLAPDLNGVATHGYNYGRVVDRFTNTFATDQVQTNNFFLSSSVDLFNGMRKQNTIRQSRVDMQAAGMGHQAARNDVRLDVVQAFLDVLGLRERMQAAEAQIAATREQMELTDALVQAGRLARADLLNVDAQLAQELFTLTDLQNQHDQRMLALGRAMQLEPRDMLTFDISAPQISDLRVMEPTADSETVLDNVLRSNPAYIQAELQVESAERAVQISRAGTMPALSLQGSLGTGYSGRNFQQVGEPVIDGAVLIGATESGEGVFSPNFNINTALVPFREQLDQNFNQSLIFTLQVPLFNQMRNRFAIDQARVRHEQSRNRMVAVRNDMQRAVLDAIVMQRSAYRQFEAAQRAVEAGGLSLEYAQERFTQGAITSIEFNTAKINLNRSTADLINAKYQYLMATKYLDILQGLPVTL
jgi:outer membrane protein